VNLLIFGASARAAAFSALRAGLEPWCADLFADLDLQARCSVMRVPSDAYPHCFVDLAQHDLPGAWIYTGGLENWPSLIQEIAGWRPLWGNDQVVLTFAREPLTVADALSCEQLPAPVVWYSLRRLLPQTGRWLLKPRCGAGGTGIHFWEPALEPAPNLTRSFLQEFIEGDACAAVYVGDPRQCRLLGITRQLVGEGWLHASPFHYCGSIGPIEQDQRLRETFERLGNALAQRFNLRGIFGVDCVLRDGVPYPVEINPRYTASVEVLEHALGIRALALHGQVFDSTVVAPIAGLGVASVVGKAILFARAALTFPADGPWMTTLRQPGDIWDLPAFADIPAAGTPIKAGRPILTFFARGDSVEACREALQQRAANLERWLFR